MIAVKLSVERFAEGGAKTALKRVVIWYLAMLITLLSVAWLIGVKISPSLVVIGAVFLYVDVFGLDGGAVYGLAKVLGGKASFERHVAFVSWWKPPVLLLQILGLLSMKVNALIGAWIYYAFIVVELAMFWVTLRRIHRLNAWRSALLITLLVVVMFPTFLSDAAVRRIANEVL